MFRPPHIESDQLYPHNTPLVLVNNTNNLATSMSCGLTSTVSTYHPPLFAVWKITACFSTLSPQALAALPDETTLHDLAARVPMGFLSRLLDIPSFNGATNALLVELALPELTESQRSQLKGRVLELYRTHKTSDGSTEVMLLELNQTPRIFQLNMLALAMKDLGYPLPFKKEKIQKIKNPFDPSHADEYAMRAVARRLKWHYGVDVWIAEESISFDSW